MLVCVEPFTFWVALLGVLFAGGAWWIARVLLSLAADQDEQWWDVFTGERLGPDLDRNLILERLRLRGLDHATAERVADHTRR